MTYILISMVSSHLKELEAYLLLLETLEILFDASIRMAKVRGNIGWIQM